MDIRNDILVKAVERAAIEQTAEEYRRRGYSVVREVKMGGRRADLVAKRDDKVIVFEFKSGLWNARKAKAVAEMRNYVAHEVGGEFRLVLVNLPRETRISIEGIEEALWQILHENTSQVDELATHITLDEVADVDISSVDIGKELIHVSGSGNVSYELQYGSDSDMRHGDGSRFTESFPFTFRLYLNHALRVDEVEELDVDISSFYE